MKTCVRLDTEPSGPCPVLIGGEHAADPNAIFIGAFTQLDNASINVQTVLAIYEMAVRDFNEFKDSGGLRDVSNGPSPLVVVVCNNSKARAPEALKHLIGEVQVPAVLAAMDQDQLLTAFDAYRYTFFVSPLNASKDLAKVSNGRLWTMLGQTSDYADIYAALMPYAEGYARADLAVAKEERDIRVVAVVDPGNAFGAELAGAVLPQLTFNGLNAKDQPANYLQLEVMGDGSNLDDVVAKAYALGPDIVLSFAGGVFTSASGKGGVMPRLNRQGWSYQRPIYILSPANAQAGNDVTVELDWLWNEVDHRDNASRVLGIGAASPPVEQIQAYSDFASNLARAFPGANPDFGNYYDAFYFLADAIYASPRQAFYDGTISATSDLFAAMRRLTDLDRQAFDIGPNAISNVFDALDAHSSIQLVGTLGAPGFDRTTGMRRESGSVFCFDSLAHRIHPDVIRYDRESKRLTFAPAPPCLTTFLSP